MNKDLTKEVTEPTSELALRRLGDILSERGVLKMEYDQISKALGVYHAKQAKDREDKRKRQQASGERMRAHYNYLDSPMFIKQGVTYE